jgi:hypothetical protein
MGGVNWGILHWRDYWRMAIVWVGGCWLAGAALSE